MTEAAPGMDAIWLIYSREHNAWWRATAAGYTTEIEQAGRYTRLEARGHCQARDPQRDGSQSEVAVLAPEAADTIERLRQQVEELEQNADDDHEEYVRLQQSRCDLESEVKALKAALREAARNDCSQYEHHDPRPWDGRRPAEVESGATIWLTPRAIARGILGEPDLATLCDPELPELKG